MSPLLQTEDAASSSGARCPLRTIKKRQFKEFKELFIQLSDFKKLILQNLQWFLQRPVLLDCGYVTCFESPFSVSTEPTTSDLRGLSSNDSPLRKVRCFLYQKFNGSHGPLFVCISRQSLAEVPRRLFKLGQ